MSEGACRECVVLVIDFGSQFTQLIARRVRDLNVYCEIVPHTISLNEIDSKKPHAIILSGSHASVTEPDSPTLDVELFTARSYPILGICYGMQYMAQALGGRTAAAGSKEFGHAQVEFTGGIGIFRDFPSAGAKNSNVWMSHGDQVSELPSDFVACGSTPTCPYAAMCHKEKRMYGVQFHMEVSETVCGRELLQRFLTSAGCASTWTSRNIMDFLIKDVRKQVGDDGDVLLAVSGGVDSSVVAGLLNKAIGKRLKCVFVDNGLLRLNEAAKVRESFERYFTETSLEVADAADIFLGRLAGVTDPEEKRKIIGRTFIEVFEERAQKLTNATYLAQGTIYPDVIESAMVGKAGLIKSHHNVGGLPESMNLKLLEPIRSLFKDEVRQLGAELGLPEQLIRRLPFPGPGLAVRILGEVTKEKCAKLAAADHVYIEELRANNLYQTYSQAFATLTEDRTVAVKGDGRTYEPMIGLRVVCTSDFMTASVPEIPFPVLQRISSRICNEVPGVSRVVLDLTSKPPATIEWE